MAIGNTGNGLTYYQWGKWVVVLTDRNTGTNR
jgi:hypothetical protein